MTPQVAHFSDASQRSSFDVAIENVRLAAGDAEKITLELIMLSAEHGHEERPPPGDQFPRKERNLPRFPRKVTFCDECDIVTNQ